MCHASASYCSKILSSLFGAFGEHVNDNLLFILYWKRAFYHAVGDTRAISIGTRSKCVIRIAHVQNVRMPSPGDKLNLSLIDFILLKFPDQIRQIQKVMPKHITAVHLNE